MIRILLVQPYAKGDRSYRTFFSPLLSYAPLTLATLKALVPDDLDVTVDVCDEMVSKISYDKKHYDIVAFTVLTACAKDAYRHAKAFRKRGAYIIMGGYHVTALPEEALGYADTVLVGPGDRIWPAFLTDYAARAPKRRYDAGALCGSEVVAPDRSAIPKRKYLPYPAVIANRGCPHSCSYCSISPMWRQCSERPVADVIREIKTLKKKMIIFFDPNFFGQRAYAMELMRALIPLHIRWAGSATIDVAQDKEVLDLARRSGCAALLVGLETLNAASLQASRKGFNDPKRYKEAIATLHRYGISVNGCFVLGFDGDTAESLRSLPAQVDYLGLNLARFSILTPTPDADLFWQLEKEGRLLTKDWRRYNQHHAVFRPKNMSPEQLEEIYREVWKQTYTFRNIFRRVKRLATASFTERVIGFGANLGFKYLGIDS